VRTPLHTPVVPQVDAAVAAHSLSGSCPAGTAAQEPTEPTRLHRSQVAVHALLQQTPSVQKPLAHSVPETQAAPVTRLQTPPVAHA
jgi:hypothetical protein